MNWWMRVLQTLALPLGHVTIFGATVAAPFGAADEARTRYLHLGKVALYQMSYGRIFGAFVPAPSHSYFKRGPRENLQSKILWGRGGISEFVTAVLLVRLPDKRLTFRRATRIGLEPTTPSVTGWCSNQLSYRATWWKLTGSNR